MTDKETWRWIEVRDSLQAKLDALRTERTKLSAIESTRKKHAARLSWLADEIGRYERGIDRVKNILLGPPKSGESGAA